MFSSILRVPPGGSLLLFKCERVSWASLLLSRSSSTLVARTFGTSTNSSNSSSNAPAESPNNNNAHSSNTSTGTTIRLSKLISQYSTNLTISHNAAETLIKQGEVTIAGTVVRSPQLLVNIDDLRQSGSVVIKVQGKGLQLDWNDTSQDNKQPSVPIVYAVHKLAGEMVTEQDPQNRRSMMQRLVQGGVGLVRTNTTNTSNGTTTSKKRQWHLKPIGRLDMSTEGLILVTNDGEYAREMELPSNQIHRVYRARVHGRLTPAKLDRIRRGGIRFQEVRYGPMKVELERPRRSHQQQRRGQSLHATPSNTWVQVTSTEGKFRQIRNVFEAIGGTCVW